MQTIDEDFDYLKRHEVIEYITQKYGSDHVAQIGTYTTLSSKIVLKDVGRVLNVDHNKINELNKTLPSTNGKVMDLADAVEELPAFQKAKEDYPEMFDLALQVQSMPRGAGIHACFPAGAIVRTETGDKPIEQIKTGERVYTHTGQLKEVADVLTRKASDIVLLKTPAQKSTRVTSNHKYLTRHLETIDLPIKKNGRPVKVNILSTPEWKPAGELRTGQDYVCRQNLFLKKGIKDITPQDHYVDDAPREFYIENGNMWELAYVTTPEHNKKEETVYNLSVYDDNSYTVDGLTVKNCGVQISPVPLNENIPLMRGKKGETVTQYEGPNLEEIGFVKFDILGLKNLSVLRIAVDLIKERHGIEIEINNIEPEDSDVFEMIRKGDTQAVFQLESMVALLAK